MNKNFKVLRATSSRMKQNRGERRYGGVMTSYQELSPISIEDDDSDLEEQALFDINKARTQQVVL